MKKYVNNYEVNKQLRSFPNFFQHLFNVFALFREANFLALKRLLCATVWISHKTKYCLPRSGASYTNKTSINTWWRNVVGQINHRSSGGWIWEWFAGFRYLETRLSIQLLKFKSRFVTNRLADDSKIGRHVWKLRRKIWHDGRWTTDKKGGNVSRSNVQESFLINFS